MENNTALSLLDVYTKKGLQDKQKKIEEFNKLIAINNYKEKKKKKNWFKRTLATIGDFAGNVVSGAVKGIEGIYDFGASIVGGVGGLISDDFQDSVKNHVAYDFTGKHVSSKLDDWTSDSYLNDSKVGNFIENVANGVGQMLPAVAVTFATGGVGAGAFITPGMATMGASAMGNATESAFKDGASYGKGMAYGVAGGAVEMATEKIGGKLFGNSVIDDALGMKPTTNTLFRTAKTGFGKTIQGAIGEGIEEGMAELVNPLTKTIYKGSDALNEYKDKEFWGRVGESAAVGAATSLAFGETVGRINRNNNNANETLAELKTLEIKEDNLHARGKLFEGGNAEKINNLRTKFRTELSESVSKMSDKTRAKYIEQHNLGDILNADGTLKQLTTNPSQDNKHALQGAKNGLASQSNKEAYSPKYYGKEDALLIKPTSHELTTSDKDVLVRVNKLNKGYNRVSTVLVDPGEIKKLTNHDAKAIEHNGVIYVERGADSDSTSKVLATHELNHTLEGTKQKIDFDNFVIKSLLQNQVLAKRFGSFTEKFAETLERYSKVFEEKYGDVSKASNEDIDLIKAEINQETLNEVISQYVSENFFTDEATIDRLASTNESIFKKIYNWIKSKVERFKIKSAEDRQVYDFLHKAESLYKKALENSRGGANFVKNIDNSDEDVVEYESIKYSKSRYDEFKTLAMQWAFSDKTKDGDIRTLYNPENNTWNKIVADKSVDEGFRIEKKIKDTPKNHDAILDLVKEVKNENNIGKQTTGESISQSVVEYRDIGRLFGYDFSSRAEQDTDGRNSQLYREKSKSKRDGNSRQGNGNSGTKFSLEEDVNSISEKDFKHHYWAKAHDILSDEEFAVFSSAISELKNGSYFEKNADGLYMIPTGENQVFNKIVFTDGDFETPSINYITQINSNNETDLSVYREAIYVSEFKGIPAENGELFEYHYSKDYDYVEFKEKFTSTNSRFSSGEQNRARINRETRYSLTRGQVAKDRANNTKMKVYSKTEAEQLINELISENLNIGDKLGSLKGKTKAQAINQMFIALNNANPGYRVAVAQNIADYIIDNAIYEDMYEDGRNEDALYRYNTIKEYRGKLDLSSIKGEIHHKYDVKPGNAIIMQWGKTQNGQGVDAVVQELIEAGIQINATNSADAFFELLKEYNNARDMLNTKAKKIRASYFNNGELKNLKNELVKEILHGYEKYGSESKFSNLVKRYVDRISFLKESITDIKNRHKAINGLFATIDRVNGLEKFKSADIELSHEVVGLIKLLKGVKTYRNNLSKNIRSIMLKYSQDVYGKKLYDLIANNGDGIENPVAKMIEDIAHNHGELTTNEIRQLDEIMRNFIHNVKEYNRVFFEGKTQNDEAIVEQAIKETREAVALKTNGFLGSMGKFTRWLTAPVWRFERLSSYRQNGIMTRVFGELQQGVDNQARFNMEVAEHFNKFFKENKKIVSDWNKQSFELNGAKLSRGQVITLYMLFQRQQAIGHLLSNDGITGTIRVTNEKHASKGNFKDALAGGADVQIDYSTLDKIKESLTDVEKEFIKLSKEFFDKISKDAKYQTDMALYGISNVGEENYIPIRVADDQIYKQLGSNEISFSELFSVYNASFNKETRPNAKNKIVVENILDVINRHSKQMASYYGLAVPLKTLNRLYNKKLNDGSKLSIEINKVDHEFERYISKLLSDLQGRGNSRTTFDKVVGKIRSLGAKAALGLNLKVLANQFVSLPASHAVGVDYKNIMKGLAQATARKTDFDKLTQYCPMLYDRFREGSNIDVGLLKENQGVFGKIDKLTELTTAPIGKIDKFICGAVWNACLEQTKSNKYADYSDEHYKEAAKLTEKAVIKTQANYTALYRPAILREQNSFLQLSTMFMSEPLQQLSLLASSIDKIYVAKKLLKQNDTPENRALLKQAKAEARSAVTAVMVDAILLTLIAQAFRWVKGQDEEDTITSMSKDFTSNFVGMFPFIKDLYTLYEGYDVTNMAYTGLTNVYNAFSELYNIVDLVTSGNQYSDTEVRGKLRKVLLGLSQTFGIPLRNLETYTKGIVEKFSTSATYRYESLFYNSSMSNYAKELNRAIENEDYKLADTIIDVMLADEKVEVKDAKIRRVMRELYEEGLDVFPKSVGKTIIYDGESISLTKRQHEKFTSIYSKANEKVSSLIDSKAFEDAPSVIKAKSIKYVYDYYYEEALKDLVGKDSDEKKYLFAQAIDITKLAIIVSEVSQIVADTDKSGKTISGSRKAKIVKAINSMKLTAIQKYMLMGYFGYKNTKGKIQVKNYIQSLKLTKTEKESLFSMCGY